jgi:predicted ester cyclase
MTEPSKKIVRRCIAEVINKGNLAAADDLCAPLLAEEARRWVAPFRESFPDVVMQEVVLIAEGQHVVGHFTCSGTHLGPWRGHPPTGRRFEGVNEVYFFRVLDGRIVDMWSLEDTVERLNQLGLATP